MQNDRPFLLHVVRRGGKRSEHRVGVIVATGPNQVGWSKCNFSNHYDAEGNLVATADKFDLNEGIQRALVRAANPNDGAKVPEQFRKHIETMERDSVTWFAKKAEIKV